MQNAKSLYWLLLIPAAALLALFCLAMSFMLAASFSGKDGGWFHQYWRFLSDQFYLSYVVRSFRVALYSTVASLLLGYPVAYAMSRASTSVRRIIALVLVLQFFSVNVTRIYSLILLLGNNGVINRILLSTGLTETPLHFMYNELGVVIGIVSATLPFVVFLVNSVLERIPPSLREMALTLGASRSRIFWAVIFPLSLPGVCASTTVVFLYSLGAFATPLLLGGGFVDMISVFSYEQALNLSNYAFAAAGAVVTLVCAFASVYAFNRITENRVRAG